MKGAARTGRPLLLLSLALVKVRLTREVRDLGGNVYAEGSLVEVRAARDGKLEVVGAHFLPLSDEEWEPYLSEEDLGRLLGG
ncbi:hypothetical protein [Rubrobacter naiadicus]|uniref:hypothetical protein n=1 Tax=Rubrobacter naiadicus TaxID=1392641 RepID=UPI002361BAC4|nr:hypothetical protein [Rubrobacter naiadicus]